MPSSYGKNNLKSETTGRVGEGSEYIFSIHRTKNAGIADKMAVKLFPIEVFYWNDSKTFKRKFLLN